MNTGSPWRASGYSLLLFTSKNFAVWSAADPMHPSYNDPATSVEPLNAKDRYALLFHRICQTPNRTASYGKINMLRLGYLLIVSCSIFSDNHHADVLAFLSLGKPSPVSGPVALWSRPSSTTSPASWMLRHSSCSGLQKSCLHTFFALVHLDTYDENGNAHIFLPIKNPQKNAHPSQKSLKRHHRFAD